MRYRVERSREIVAALSDERENPYLEFFREHTLPRLQAIDPRVDVDAVCDALGYIDLVCSGDPKAGAAGQQPIGTRFGFVRAPRSTVLQPGPVHGGVTDDPARQLEHLLERLVG